ncbi:diacylglycerol O-acyltransferase 1-like [Convolutriloba macropyga]|uniref:diacylglycerol O-acyltransferase 1-like n=1 Tax=Convolutriloba macropyga TaxID=536237 RepID=UPI003F51D5A6
MVDRAENVRRRRFSDADQKSQSDSQDEDQSNDMQISHLFRKCHFAKPSPFTSSSGFKDYSGILNWGMVLLVLAGVRLALENFLKYGVLISPKQYLFLFLENPWSWPFTCTLILINIHISGALYLERSVVRNLISESFAHLMMTFNLVILIVAPAALILCLPAQPQTTVPALGMVTIVFLKLISYKQVNSAHRMLYNSKEASQAMRSRSKSSNDVPSVKKCGFQYPFNLRWRNMYYYMLAPTLCYEVEFPTPSALNSGMNWWFLLRRVSEFCFLSFTILAFFQQWIMPALNNSNELFLTMNYTRLVEKLLKLAVPNQILWLFFFYLFFHSALNAVAEVTGFVDREFYLDWWNSRNVAEFWQKWNIPVHKFGKRHIYKPLLKKGVSKIQASLVVFLVSAFFHEYLVSVPLKMFRVWIFLGMMAQVPLAVISLNLTPRQGNILMWLSLMLGQPAVVFMYYHDYFIQYIMADNTGVDGT